jgi:hypothetical protein
VACAPNAKTNELAYDSVIANQDGGSHEARQLVLVADSQREGGEHRKLKPPC